jgi:hypothetical protein
MADYVKRRMTAAKIGIGFACAAVLGGIVEWVRPEAARIDASPAASYIHTNTVGKSSITSAQVKNHSLLYKDFKPGQVIPYSKLKEIEGDILDIKGESQDEKHKDEIEILSLRQDLKDVNQQLTGVASLESRNHTQLGSLGASITNLKAKGIVQGHGSVFSGMQDVGIQGQPEDLLTVPEWVKVQGLYVNNDVPAIRIVNLSSSYSFDVIWSDGPTEHDDTLPAGKGQHIDLAFATGDDLITAQLLSGDGRPITLTLSRIADQGGQSSRFVAQALAAS